MTSTSNSNTMISRSKLLDISDLNTYFTSSLFLLFGLGGNDAIITVDEDNSIISKYLLIIYQRIIRNVSISSNTVIQLLFDFATTIYLGINSNSNDDEDAAAADGGSGSIVLSPAAHLLGFGYKLTSSSSSSSTSSNVISSLHHQQQQQHNRRRRRRSRKLQIILYAFFRFVVPKLYEIMKRKGIDYINNKEEEEEEEEEDVSSLFSSSPLTLQLSQEQQEKKEGKKEDDGKVLIRTTKLLQQISLNRKKLLVQKIIQFIDTTIPVVRLTLLLSCWNTNTKQNTTANQYGGNVSMFLSGLSYTKTMSSSSPLPIASSYSSTLFVLYAHRRWFHREFVDVVWNRIGRSLITTSTEINDMITTFYQKQKQYLLFLYKQKILSRYYKNKNKDRIIKVKANINNNNYDDENENDDNDSVQQHHYCCQLCNTTNVIIPYRFIDCCQQIVCYICLWNYIMEFNTNSNNNNNHNNNSNNNNTNNNKNNNKNNNNKNTKITIPCPICYQDIQHCQPV